MSWLPRGKIVVPVDFSENSAESIRTALELVADPASVHAIHVMIPLDAASPVVVWGNVDDSSRKEIAQGYFDEFLQSNEVAGITSCIRIGDPGFEIADFAREIQADLIVIPSHGYHGVKRLMMGSVAERVIRHAESPVLVLRRGDAA